VLWNSPESALTTMPRSVDLGAFARVLFLDCTQRGHYPHLGKKVLTFLLT
jgi:hypothetical protein